MRPDPARPAANSIAALLSELDVNVHRSIFEYALHDSNPQVARLARKVTAGKGYLIVRW